MKKITQILMIMVLAIFIVGNANAQKLSRFTGDLGKKAIMGKQVRLPYTDVTSYFGYVKSGVAPDEIKDGKKYYYLYIWIPIAAPEIGVRMISPVPKKITQDEKDFVAQEFIDNKDERKKYFDTWISFERANGIVSIDKVINGAPNASWMRLGTNDDSGEMPKQPSGRKYNSLMRVTSDIKNPLKSLVIGLYRIGFTSYKRGEVEGSFLAQVGAPIKIPGIMIAKDLETLVKMVKEGKK